MPNPLRMRRRVVGNQYPTLAVRFVGSPSPYYGRADNASLSTGDIDVCLWAWLYFDSVATNAGLIGKVNGAGNLEYSLRFTQAAASLRFLVSSNGTATTSLDNTSWTPVVNQWVFIVAWHDSVNNLLKSQVNNGTVVSAVYTAGIFDSTAEFRVGLDGDGTNPFLGRMDCVGFSKRILSTVETDKLYWGGVGMAYRDLDAGLKTSLAGFWDFDGNGRDSSGNGNHLTASNGPSFAVGKR